MNGRHVKATESDNSSCAMATAKGSYDGVIEEFGKYQALICLLLSVCTLPNGISTMMIVFTHDTPEFWCKPTAVVNQNMSRDFADTGNESRHHDPCYSYEHNDSSNVHSNISKCDQGWIYEDDKQTVVTEWDLVCDRAWIKPVIGSIFLGGVLAGSAFSGIFSDRFGRRPVFLWSTFAQFASMFAAGFSINVEMYAVMMFVVSLFTVINYQIAVVMGLEITGPRYRIIMTIATNIAFAVGYMILPLMAYLATDWRWFMKAFGLMGLLYIPTYWIFPESPRWLLKQRNKEKANQVLERIAQINGTHRREETELNALSKEDEELEVAVERRLTYIDLVRLSAMRKRTAILCSIWFCASSVYYCISLNTGDLGKNLYINCFVTAAVEIPAYIGGAFICERFGRTHTMATFFAVGGVTYGVVPILRIVHEAFALASAMVAKIFISSQFMLIYMYTCEVYPTLLRHIGLGACSAVSRIGSMLVPYLIFAGNQIHPSIPYVVMGLTSVLVGILCLLMPETKGKVIPATVEEALKLKRKCISRPSAH